MYRTEQNRIACIKGMDRPRSILNCIRKEKEEEIENKERTKNIFHISQITHIWGHQAHS